MKEDKFTLRIVLLPRFRNNLLANSFVKQKNIPRDKDLYNTLIKYDRLFDRNGKSLHDCWFEADGWMVDNFKTLFNENTMIQSPGLLPMGYRYIGYYYTVELDELLNGESKYFNIWIR